MAAYAKNYETVRLPRAANGHPAIHSDLLSGADPHSEAVPAASHDEVARQESQDSTATAAQIQIPVPSIVEPPEEEPEPRPSTPIIQHPDTSAPVAAAEEVTEEQKHAEDTPRTEPAPTHVEPEYAPATSTPQPLVITRENPVNEELFVKYNQAMGEVDRLHAFVASLQQQLKLAEEAAEAASTVPVPPPPASELRRRTRRLSDADSVAPSGSVTMVEEVQIHSDGVPLNVVVVVALVVFVTTYLFF